MKNSLLGKIGKELAGGLVFGLLALFVFVKLAEDLIENELNLFDRLVYNVIYSINSLFVTQIMKIITIAGSATILIFLCFIVWLYLQECKKQYWNANMLIISLVGSFLMDQVLKWLFHRNRPEILPLVVANGYSFPSGHTMVSFSFYGMLTYILFINTVDKRWRIFYVFLAVFLILTIGISRIYLGVHYASDVLAGYAAGGFWLTGCILGLRTIRLYKNKTNKKS
jgi:undecaprenyl-diphosphatase